MYLLLALPKSHQKRFIVKVADDGKMVISRDITELSIRKTWEVFNEEYQSGNVFFWRNFQGKFYGHLCQKKQKGTLALGMMKDGASWGFSPARPDSENSNSAEVQRVTAIPLSRSSSFFLRNVLAPPLSFYIYLDDENNFTNTEEEEAAVQFSFVFYCPECHEWLGEYSGLYEKNGQMHSHLYCNRCCDKLAPVDPGNQDFVRCPERNCNLHLRRGSTVNNIVNRSLSAAVMLLPSMRAEIEENVTKMIRETARTKAGSLQSRDFLRKLYNFLLQYHWSSVLLVIFWLCKDDSGNTKIKIHSGNPKKKNVTTLRSVSRDMISEIGPREFFERLQSLTRSLPLCKISICEKSGCVLDKLKSIGDGRTANHVEDGASGKHTTMNTGRLRTLILPRKIIVKVVRNTDIGQWARSSPKLLRVFIKTEMQGDVARDLLPDLDDQLNDGNWKKIYKEIYKKKKEIIYRALLDAQTNSDQTKGPESLLNFNQIIAWTFNGNYKDVEMERSQKGAHKLLLRCHYDACMLFAEAMRKKKGYKRISLGLGLIGVYDSDTNIPYQLAVDALVGTLEKYDFFPIDVTVFLHDKLPIVLLGEKYH